MRLELSSAAGTAAVCTALFVIAVAAVPRVAGAQTRADESPERSGPASWPTRPSIVLGDFGRLEPGVRVQSQFITSSKDDLAVTGPPDRGLTIRNPRIGITGRFFGRVEVQAEGRMNDARPWRDLFADVEVFRQLHVRAGHFKVPFSREQLSSSLELDFTHRAAIVDDLVPSRSTGVMVHGRVADRAVRYQVGVFEDTRQPRFSGSGPRLLSSRVTVAPLKKGRHRGADTLQLSAAWQQRSLNEGRTGARGQLTTGETFFEPIYANGTRTLVGLGAVWEMRTLTFASELIRSTDTRVGQALSGGDLSDLVSRGGYATAVWQVIHGKGRRRGTAPFRELNLTGRFDWVRFGSARAVDIPSRDPRADNVAPLSKRTLTLGTTWWLNRWMAVHANAIREGLVDPFQRYPVGTGARWTAVVRSQVAM